MGRLVSMVLMVVGVWVSIEVYTHGVGGAFGGAFSRLSGDTASAAAPGPTTPQRAGAAVERAHTESEERLGRMLGD